MNMTFKLKPKKIKTIKFIFLKLTLQKVSVKNVFPPGESNPDLRGAFYK